MRNFKNTVSCKLLAVILAAIFTLSIVPVTVLTAFAATAEHPDAVTVSVIDESGKAIEGAAVEYSINSVSGGDGAFKGNEETDTNGCVEILKALDFEEGMTIETLTVTMDGYEVSKKENEPITDSKQNFEITLSSTEISDITVKGNTDATYDGEPHALLTVSGLKTGDIVKYTVTNKANADDTQQYSYEVGKDEEIIPSETDAGTYSVQINVERDGKVFNQSVDAVINRADIDIQIKPKDLTYNGTDQELVEVTGSFSPDDKITWKVGENEFSGAAIPKAMAAGTYNVKLTVNRGSNYNEYSSGDVTVEIKLAEIELDGLEIKAKSDIVYDGNAKTFGDLLEINDEDFTYGSYELYCSLEEKGDYVKADDFDKITDAGEYKLYIQVRKDNYNSKDYPEFPINITVHKATQKIEFANDVPESISLDSENPQNNVYDFSATEEKIEELDDQKVEYSLVDASDPGVASISAEGMLTVNKAGIVTVKAIRSGNNNYADTVIYKTVTVNDNGVLQFEKDTETYILDEYGAASSLVPKKAADDNGAVTYSVKEDVGVSVDSQTGAVTVSDRSKLAEAMGIGGEVTVTVEAEKAAGTVTANEWVIADGEWENSNELTKEVYSAASASYKLVIKYDTAPEFSAACKITEPDETGWYNAENDAIVTPLDSEKYSIALDSPLSFSDSQQITQQGTKKHYVFLKDLTTKRISAGIEINIKIDTEIPTDLKVEYAKSPVDEFLEKITLGFYNPSVTLKFSAKDIPDPKSEIEYETSGLDRVEWTYTREEGQSETNLENENGVLQFNEDGTAILTLPESEAKQYRGNISFTVYDKAGNKISSTDSGNIFVVDTIKPEMTIKYAGSEPYTSAQNSYNGKYYFNGDVDIQLTVTEANFYKEDVKVYVSINGGSFNPISPEWNNQSVDTHIGTYKLSGDGDYVVKVEYTDKSGNVMDTYTSDIITVDTIAPEVKVEYVHNDYEQKTVFTVKEHNFRAVDAVIDGTIKDINNKNYEAEAVTAEFAKLADYLHNSEWEEIEKDTYRIEYDGYANGIYHDVKFNYTDLANREAETFTTGDFIIDHEKPTTPEIKYSASLAETVLNAVTFGFYNPDVTVTFTSYDNYSGVDYFNCSYTRQDGASEKNVEAYSDIKLDAVQDNSDLSKFTASVKLPLNEADQLRGYMAVSSTDNYKNTSEKITDSGKILVVDTVSPKMSVEFSRESKKVGDSLYYGSDKQGEFEVTFKVTESNFFEEDVVVKLSKNGEVAQSITPVWTDVNTDEHIGKYTVSGDGHYIIYVDYKDRSNNVMTSYSSDMVTIDTVNPVINVEYRNKDIINRINDSNGNLRDYYDEAQTAVITITEHNFDANDAILKIIGKDVTGAELNLNELINESSWSTNGDTHTMTVNYYGDANYTFDMEYTDLALNKATDYSNDYFTVDTAAPNIEKIEYSTSILETVLSNISFGFYNAKMKVTITANDITSGVHKFDYSYINADNVSSVNAQLLNQAIEEAGIVYSKDNKTATMSFEIPKLVLGRDNQFNGKVKFDSIDRAGNKVDRSENKRIVVDNIAPNIKVAYNAPVNEVNGISYYSGDINGTITINEANFYSSDVDVRVARNGGASAALPTVWADSGKDVHTGKFTLTGDADYIVTISYKDKSGNKMDEYKSNQLTIDTKIDKPTYTINGAVKDGDNGGSYNNDVISVSYKFEDQNYSQNNAKLTKANYAVTEDVTSKFVKTSLNNKGGSGTFEIPKEVGNDGIYTLTVSMKDKANHSTESHLKFIVNRYGSVYEYSSYLCSLIKDGGQYIKIADGKNAAITDDLVITEYNADELKTDALKILITRDGEPINAKFTSSPDSSNGWHKYIYSISKDNFKEDGLYKITLASEDAIGNISSSVPDNSIYKEGDSVKQVKDSINFTVDTKAPEIKNIVNLDEKVPDKDKIQDGKLNVQYTIVDLGGLAKIQIYLNGQVLTEITNFSDTDNNSRNNYSGNFDINESSDVQKVRLVVTDLAGNVTDTDSENFEHGDLYEFNNAITVSTNAFVRWYRNTPLFIGTVCAAVIVVGGILFIVAKKRKKDK